LEGYIYLVLSLLVLGLVWHVNTPAFKGSMGEARVNSAIERSLNDQEYKLFKDLTLRSGAGTTQIDHVVVSRFGVFVIETKNMKGWIFGQTDQAQWTQQVFRHRSRFQNPIRQNYKHLKTLEEILDIRARQMHGVVAFVGGAVPKTPMPDNVVWDTGSLVDYVRSKQIILFDDSQVGRLTYLLASQRLEPGRKTKTAHISGLRAELSARREDSSKCPRCGAPVVSRMNAKNGERFLGCSRYPRCRGTRPLT
jgi:hypothetical protein